MNHNNTNNKTVIELIATPFVKFFKIEASGGIVLIFFTILALIIANSGMRDIYNAIINYELLVKIGNFKIELPVLLWINDGLMAIFFFVVGLEIKREILTGELSSVKQASLPVFAAIGGMVLPASVYLLLNNNPETANGWGIPMATDIAFSLGVLSLLGKRVPLALKVFLVAFAIVDDLGAILIIAFFYTSDLSLNYLFIGLALFIVLITLNLLNVNKSWIYFSIGLVIWYMFLKAHVHPTIAGVLIALTIPLKRKIDRNIFVRETKENLDKLSGKTTHGEQIILIGKIEELIGKVKSPLQTLEHKLHSFVTFVIMPIFAFANFGVVFDGVGFADIFSSVSMNIEFGLVVGKVSGILIFSWLAVKLKIAVLPKGANWKQITGIGFLGGLGFTMSLFIANLAFDNPEYLNPAKIGILIGSLISGIIGFFILNLTLQTISNLKNNE